MSRFAVTVTITLLLFGGSVDSLALPLQGPVLASDFNGNGSVEIVAFGDSLTRGVGDGIPPGQDVESGELTEPSGEAGYPQRVERLLRVPVSNHGRPGEELIESGLHRFAALIPQLRPDVVIVGEGANDAERFRNSDELFYAYQTMANIASASGVRTVFITISPLCCQHSGYSAYARSYNNQIRAVAALNEAPLIDLEQGFVNICGRSEECSLLNLPEGLHPNSAGYDIAGEMVSGVLFGFDLLVPGNAQQLELALGLPPGSLHVQPNPLPPQ